MTNAEMDTLAKKIANAIWARFQPTIQRFEAAAAFGVDPVIGGGLVQCQEPSAEDSQAEPVFIVGETHPRWFHLGKHSYRVVPEDRA